MGEIALVLRELKIYISPLLPFTLRSPSHLQTLHNLIPPYQAKFLIATPLFVDCSRKLTFFLSFKHTKIILALTLCI